MDVSSRHSWFAACAATVLATLPLTGRSASDTAAEPTIAPDSIVSDTSEVAPARPDEATSADSRPAIFAPYAVLTAEGWRNSGGRQNGDWWDTLLDFGLSIDTGCLGGPADSTVVVQAQWTRSRNRDAAFSNNTGAFNPVSNAFAADRLRVFNLHYRQSWADGARALKIGQLALDDDFMRSDFSGFFLNPAFGPLPSQVGTSLCAHCDHTSAFPIYAVAAPGVWMQLHPTAGFSWQTGVYYGAPGADTPHNHGFAWRSFSDSGIVAFSEIGWRYSVAGRVATLHFGGAFHTGHFDDFSALNAGRSATTARGLYNFYAIHDIALVADAAGKTKLGAFTRIGVSPQHDRSIVTAYGDAGVNWFAPFASRPDDIAGLAVSCSGFGRPFRELAAADAPAATETTIEFTYKAQLNAHVSVQVDVQHLLNIASSAAARTTATVVGLRTQFSF